MIDQKQVAKALGTAAKALESAMNELEQCIEADGREPDAECTCGYCTSWFALNAVSEAICMLHRERHSIHNADKCAYCGAYSSLGKPK